MKVIAPKGRLSGEIKLPASKSISNRVLIIDAMCNGGVEIDNLSTAKDTETMVDLLADTSCETFDVGPAGTTMRFLTAYFSTQPGTRIITGSERMKARPIGVLVDALRALGADVTYMEEEGYPPLKITGKQLTQSQVELDGGVSSQYITALMLIAPSLSNGLTITLTGALISIPYINMTAEIMKYFGAQVERDGQVIKIKPGHYVGRKIFIEPDWSGASYWFEMMAFAEKGSELFIHDLSENSLQGDRVIEKIAANFGVQTTFTDSGATLLKASDEVVSFDYDYEACPDIAQTVAAMAAGCGNGIGLTGLKTLRIKETDRITAMKDELAKLSVEVNETSETMSVQGTVDGQREAIATYHDHRMAMCFAPLAIPLGTIDIDDPDVVVKSYPEFWDHLSAVGFTYA